MADVDEDVIPRGPSHDDDIDLSDETQDFRFLLAFSYATHLMYAPHLLIDNAVVMMQKYLSVEKRTLSLTIPIFRPASWISRGRPCTQLCPSKESMHLS